MLDVSKRNKKCGKNPLCARIVLRVFIFVNFAGLRFVNCKSGKDRTGMAATLEQIQILSREYDLAEHEYQKALDAMRR